MLQKDDFYYLQFNGRFYLTQYKCETIFGHYFSADHNAICVGNGKLLAENPVLWKVKQ